MKKINIAFLAIASLASCAQAMEGGEEMMVYSNSPVSFFSAAPEVDMEEGFFAPVADVAVPVAQSVEGAPAEVAASSVSVVPESVQVNAPVQTVADPFPASTDCVPCAAQTDTPVAAPVSKPRFSVIAGFKKTVSFLTAPIVAHPVISALVASGGLLYALKNGYVKQLLIKMGIKQNDTKEHVPVMYN